MTTKNSTEPDDPGIQRNVRIKKSNLDAIEDLMKAQDRKRDNMINYLLRRGIESLESA